MTFTKTIKKTIQGILKALTPKNISVFQCQDIRVIPVFKSERFHIPSVSDICGNTHESIPSYEIPIPEFNLYILKNGKFIAGKEEIFTSQNQPLQEITSQKEIILNPFDFWKLNKCKKISGKVLYLSLSGLEDNYYHFNVEFLARYLIFLKSGVEYDWIIFPQKTAFQRDFLELLEIDKNKVIVLKKKAPIIAEELLFSDLINDWKLYEYRKSYISYVKQYLPCWITEIYSLIKAKSNIKGSKTKNIYISRQKADYRKVLNETELITMLKRYEFECVYLEKLSVQEQIQLFKSACMVIAPHGAGLVNTSYCDQNVVILEIFSEFYHDPSFRIQALTLKHHYHYYIGKTNIENRVHPQQENIWVDVKVIEDWLLNQFVMKK